MRRLSEREGDDASDIRRVQGVQLTEEGMCEWVRPSHRSVYKTWLNKGNLDPKLLHLFAKRMAKSDQRPLARDIDRLPDIGFATRQRSHKDDVTGTLASHSGEHSTHGIGGA